MARFDKYDPISGGFRAKLAVDFALGTPVNGIFPNYGKVYPVSLNASGLVTVGAIGAQVGLAGVMILTVQKFAGDVVDIMTHGEIVDLNTVAAPFDNFTAAPIAGQKYFGVAADGTIIAATAAANYFIGHTVEATRLVVRVGNHALGG